MGHNDKPQVLLTNLRAVYRNLEEVGVEAKLARIILDEARESFSNMMDDIMHSWSSEGVAVITPQLLVCGVILGVIDMDHVVEDFGDLDENDPDEDGFTWLWGD